MSQENVELVRYWFDRWNAGDRETRGEEIHPEHGDRYAAARPYGARARCRAPWTAASLVSSMSATSVARKPSTRTAPAPPAVAGARPQRQAASSSPVRARASVRSV